MWEWRACEKKSKEVDRCAQTLRKKIFRVFNLGADSRYNMSFLSRLGFSETTAPDILHTHLPRADIAGALISRVLNSTAFICSVHGIYRDRWFGTWAAPFMRRAYQEGEAVIAISSAVKNWLQRGSRNQ